MFVIVYVRSDRLNRMVVGLCRWRGNELIVGDGGRLLFDGVNCGRPQLTFEAWEINRSL